MYLEVRSCYEPNCFPPQIPTLKPFVTVFRDRTFKEVINVKWGHKGGILIQWDQRLIRRGRERPPSPHLHAPPCADPRKGGRLSASREDSSPRNLTLLAPWAQTFSPQNCETKFCCSTHSVCGTSLWRPEETKTDSGEWKSVCRSIDTPILRAVLCEKATVT